MKKVLTVIVVIYQVSVSQCALNRLLPSHKYVFEYGDDYGEQTFAKNGRIGLLEKVVQIPITVPQCSEITYVRVEVSNVVSIPEVAFSKDTQTVEIFYQLLQFSQSSYQVVAKTAAKPYCETSASRRHEQEQGKRYKYREK